MKKRKKQIDDYLLFFTLVLVCFGALMVYSASAFLAERNFGEELYYFKKHLLWLFLGMIALFIASRINYSFWNRKAIVLVLFTIVLLVAVLIFGESVSGARRWFRFGRVGFQPSELAKLAVVIFLASYLDRKRSRIKNFKKGLLAPLAVVGIISFLILLEPDLGTPLLLGGITLLFLFLVGVKKKHLIFLLGGVILATLLAILTVPYRLERMKTFLNPWEDPQGRSYQLVQSLYALGSGGVTGRGLGTSNLKLFYLPEPHTDFIFPIIGEELGLVGTLGVIVLFFLFFWRGWKIALRAKDQFGQLLGLGITALIVGQAFFNIGVAIGFLPTKGLPLPFLSFGGSSLVATLFAVGILLNISRENRR
jgi:cell division protein FtsW